MKKILVFAMLIAALSMPVAPALAASGPSAAIMAPINAVIAATNANKASAMDAYFRPDAVVVDEFAPYEWTGANAASRWWSAFDKLTVQMHASHFHAVAQAAKQYSVSGNSAYVVVPLVLTFGVKGKPQRETGLWIFTLQRSGSAWKIATVAWGTLTSTM